MNAWNLADAAALLSPDFCFRLTQSLLHFVWQGLVIGLAVWILDWLFRASPQRRYAIGVAGLLVMLACVPATFVAFNLTGAEISSPSISDPVARPAEGSNASGASLISSSATTALVADGPPSFPSTSEAATVAGAPIGTGVTVSWQLPSRFAARIAPYSTFGYLLGVTFMLARLGIALSSGHRLRSSAAPLSDPAILAMAARQARRLGMKLAPTIAWCQRAAVPMVLGIVRPMILLPTAIASGLSPDQLEALLAHELAHLKRFDLFVNLVQRLAESVLFFHPAVWYVSRRISIEREHCCDDCVVAAGWGRVEYADALVRMAEVCAAMRGLTGLEGAALLAASGESPSQFKRRVLRLLDAQDHLRVGLSRGWLLVAIGGVLLAIVAIPLATISKPHAEAAQPMAASEKAEVASESHKPNQPAEKPADDRPAEKLFFRGQSALDRIAEVKPAWSEEQEGVQFAVALIGDEKQFRAGQRVPLEMFVRNVGQEEVEVTLSADFLANVPEVKNETGEAVPIERILLLGTVPLYREFLKPGEAFGFRHLGVGLGPNPNPKQFWHPYWPEPKSGKYTLAHTHAIGIDPADPLIPGKQVKFTGGMVEFEVVDGAASDRRPTPDEAKRAFEAARLDRQHYLEGTFPNDERLHKADVFVAEQALRKSQASLESAKRLAAKGLITRTQMQPAEAAVQQAEGQLELAQGKLVVLRKFTKEKTLRALDRKVVDALETLLEQRVALKVTDRPLIFVLDDLEKAHEIPVTIDLKELHARGPSEQARVTVDMADKPLREVFKAVLALGGLDFDVSEEGIRVPGKAKPPADEADKPASSTSISVKYDIVGAEDNGQIFVQHIGGRDIIGTENGPQLATNPVKKGDTLELSKLDPGDYQVARHRTIRIGGLGMSRFLDRRRFKLAAGETKSLDFTRPKGQQVTGTVVGLKEAGLATAVVNVCSEEAKDDRSVSDLDVTLFDSRLCAADGAFQTEKLAPGRYKIIVEGYVITPERLRLSGIIRPSYLGTADLTVPEQGEAAKVEVKLEDAEKLQAKEADSNIEVHYDIPGMEDRGRFVVEGPQGSIGPETVGSLKVNYVPNGQTLKLENLPAGQYQVTRYRTLMLEDAFGASRFLDRRQYELKGGESTKLDITRPGGKRVTGRLLGLKDTGINKVLVNVCADSAENLASLSRVETTIFDALLAEDDHSFTTEPLLPGKYTIIAEGYLQLTPQQRVSTGDIEPRYVGVEKFTVPQSGEAPAMEVKLEDNPMTRRAR